MMALLSTALGNTHPSVSNTLDLRPCEAWLLGQNDGPMHEALKRLHGATIHLPNRTKDRPDQERLALRFERFKVAA
jgi:hypothetical protein